ncbi:3-phosphoserine/phosphohydroxythreonine transaminase [Aliifodinibius sp. S!AR15-10]|uniref:3-phosphoserine/phosphohydroxythreonine transaminase n=1 Tax=Aliifodinibius sp. S!AR15-10 TaxID=2950437 RepID=UPI002854DC65|nr:3-phosphoserine/phosphohydroxythreonine transaminase [Aliifodinibius sp. S!AR15-10]MDR8392074.1 3-phosphoserine/phosphohydroxythreonine transaminase [Aliifodinibius sp. S!AR15-10]
MTRVHNFSAGPAALPLEVIKHAQQELTDYKETGRSIMELSHRSAHYEEIDQQAKARLRNLLGLGDKFEIMFLQGGASSQFMMAPYNFLGKDQTADYIDTGRWSAKAIKEAEIFGNVHVPFSSAEGNYDRVPTQDELKFSDNPQYVHFTSNNTVAGTQFPVEPDTNGVPLVCDASSDFLSRPIDVDKYGIIYAGAQKNVGPAGVTVVIIKKDFLAQANTENVPTILQYGTHTGKIFNTPPTFNVYMVNLVLKWIEGKGGLSGFKSFNEKKAKKVYDAIDADDFYRGAVDKESRSLMNVTFRLPSEELEQKFVDEAVKHDLYSLKGHRSVGGIRASIYNACPMESVDTLVDFMNDFRSNNG